MGQTAVEKHIPGVQAREVFMNIRKFSCSISTGVCRKSHWRKADVFRQPVAQGSVTQHSFATARCVARENPQISSDIFTNHVQKLKEIKGTLEMIK